MIHTHTFNNKKYHIYLGPLKGITDVNRTQPDLLVRTSSISDRQILITIIHEALHASNWDATEKIVDRTSKDIGSFLWRIGYRWDKNNE